MTFDFDMHCSQCGAVLHAKNEWIGKTARCNTCQYQFTIQRTSSRTPSIPTPPPVSMPSTTPGAVTGSQDVPSNSTDNSKKPFPIAPYRNAILLIIAFFCIVPVLWFKPSRFGEREPEPVVESKLDPKDLDSTSRRAGALLHQLLEAREKAELANEGNTLARDMALTTARADAERSIEAELEGLGDKVTWDRRIQSVGSRWNLAIVSLENGYGLNLRFPNEDYDWELTAKKYFSTTTMYTLRPGDRVLFSGKIVGRGCNLHHDGRVIANSIFVQLSNVEILKVIPVSTKR